MKISKKIFNFIILLIVIFIISLISTILLYPINEKIELPIIKTEDIIYIDEFKPEKLSFRAAIAEALQVPLRLKWYNIYFENNNTLKGNDCIEIEPGSPHLRILFSEGNPDKFNQSTLDNFAPRTRSVNAGEKGFFTYKGDEGFSYRIYHAWGGKCLKNASNKMDDLNINYTIYAKPNMTAWWAKFLVLFIIWLNIGALLKGQFKD